MIGKGLSQSYIISHSVAGDPDPDYVSIRSLSMSGIYDDILPSPVIVTKDRFNMSTCPVYERQSSETTLSLASSGFDTPPTPIYCTLTNDQDGWTPLAAADTQPTGLATTFQPMQ